MGRHLYFFMIIEDEKVVLNLANELGDYIIDDRGFILSQDEIVCPQLFRFYIAAQNSKVIIKDNGFVDSYRSDIIEFKRSMTRSSNKMDCGRIWVEMNYYDESGNSMTKEKWLSDRFEKYRKIIKINCRISKSKSFYVGNQAYTQYKTGNLKLMAGPILEVEVE